MQQLMLFTPATVHKAATYIMGEHHGHRDRYRLCHRRIQLVYCLHEIGHALGLSHPFDGGAADGSTLNLNLDSQRNTVMTYVQTDRNVRIANSGGSLSIGNKVNISTPGLLDIEAMEHLYGSTGWSHNNTATTYGGGAGIDAFDNNYDSIRVIADSGGEDTLDASGVTATENIIDLTPGTYSSINYYATDAEKIAAVAGGSQSAIDWFTGQVATMMRRFSSQ